MERIRRTYRFWKEHGSRHLVLLILRKAEAVVEGKPLFNALPGSEATSVPSSLPLEDECPSVTPLALEDQRFPGLRPLRTFAAAAGAPRISLVTDSISKGSMFGGVGTALLLAAQVANRLDARLRIVTRTERPDPENVHRVLEVYGVRLRHEPQLQFASIHDAQSEVDVQPGELFITTSWWTTHSTLAGVSPERIVYLLQEDERMFYPYGDDRLRCEEVLSRNDLRFVINTELLWDHLVATGLDNIRNRAVWFEPAFPASVFHRRPQPEGQQRKRLFFYARPNNLRNLFYLGLKVLDRALSTGVLEAADWEILLVGSHIPDVSFGPGVNVHRLENLDWSTYADVCGSVDLALSLMYTPHPSYPPLDLAASGAVVVTNRFPGKLDLSRYSPNILCADPTVDALVAALAEGARRISVDGAADAVAVGPRLMRDWEQAFAPVVDAIAASEA